MISSNHLRITCVFILVCTAYTLASDVHETKKPKPSSLGFVITDVVDTDNIGARLVVGDRKATLRMANVVPFAKWPQDLTKEEKKLKDDGLAFLGRRLKDKRVVITGVEKGTSIHGDLVLQEGEPFTSGNPSTLGWGIVHLNCMLIEEGYSIYLKDPPELFFNDANLGERKQSRETLYSDLKPRALR